MTGEGGDTRSLLIAWAEAIDEWVRWTVAEVIATSGPLGEPGVEEAYLRMLSEKGLSNETFEPVPPIGGHDDASAVADSLVVNRLEGCDGVNALATGQSIEFNPRLTVLFGENGSGKSGYVRVLKRLASGRSVEPVLGNVYSPDTSAPAARVAYSVGGDELEFDWHNEAGVPPFTRMAVFDSGAMSLHLDSDLNYVFTPADLALFAHVHAAIDAVRAKADAAVAEARPRANPFLPRFPRGTTAYQHVETLGASSDLAAIEALAVVPAGVQEELQRRRARVDALRPESIASRLELARGDHDLYEALVRLCDRTAAFDIGRYSAAISQAQEATSTFERVTAAALPKDAGLPARETEAFVRAGEAVLAASGREEYPSDGDECIYCAQALAPDAVTTVTARRAWVNDASAKARDAANGDATATARLLSALPLDALAERIAAKGTAAGDEAPPVLIVAGQLITAVRVAVESAARRADVEWAPVEAASGDLRPLAEAALANASEMVTALEGQEAERIEAYNKEKAELAELEGRAILATVLGEVRSFVERARWSDRLATVIRPVPARLRSLTEAAKSASDEVLNRGFEQHFEREAEMLRAPRVRLDFPGRKGQAARRKMLVPDHRLSEILSEGEQRVIALADFLAEASLRAGAAPLVFDDPVNSLDYKRLDYVVTRIVQLSEDQQVIVFTHNIWFAVELLSRFEASPGACSYYDVNRTESATGVVTGGSHPRSDTVKQLRSEINVLLQDAASMTGESQAALIERAYDKIRAWCEVVVEEEILQGVTKRYQPNVQMTKLSQIKADRLEAVVGTFMEIFNKACRLMGGHSQPLETLAVRASLDEVKKDWEEAQAARKAYLA